MKCAAHPDVETNLSCGKCSKPICPRCMVETPVGARCRECARLHRLPTYRVTPRYYLKGTAAMLGAAIFCGVTWGLIRLLVPFLYLNLLLAPAAGYLISEAAGLATNRKRGTGLAVAAGCGVVLSYFIALLLPGTLYLGIYRLLLDLVALALGVFTAVNRLR